MAYIPTTITEYITYKAEKRGEKIGVLKTLRAIKKILPRKQFNQIRKQVII